MKNILLVLGCIFLALQANSATLKDQAGGVYDGDIIEVDGNEVIIVVNGAPVTVDKASLDADSGALVDAWVSEHPEFVDIPKKMEENPVPVRTSQPDNRSKLQGMVAVFVIIGEDGKVVDAYVHKSSDERLNEESVKAVKKWRFKPGKIGGKATVCKILIPFRYS